MFKKYPVKSLGRVRPFQYRRPGIVLFQELFLEDKLYKVRKVASPDLPLMSSRVLLPDNPLVAFLLQFPSEVLHPVNPVVLLSAGELDYSK